MKKNMYLFSMMAIILFTCLLSSPSTFAQVPGKMSYQAVVRDAADNLVTDQEVGMQISILQGATDGTPVYVETHQPTTNANGLVTLEIGDGTVISGSMADIDWANGPYFLKTETDPSGGNSYSITGTSQLLSVPYAMHAGSSGDGWSLNGNTGTEPESHFIGTSDNQPLVFRVNNTEKMRLNTQGALELSGTGNSVFFGKGAGAHDDLTDNQNVFVGDSTGYNNTSGHHNAAFGNFALSSNIYGRSNTGSGANALRYNTSGNHNTATGFNSLYHNTSGQRNTGSGVWSLYHNTSGNDNTAKGYQALYNNTTGYSNVAIGVQALRGNTDRSNLVAVGDSALYHNGVDVTYSHEGKRNTAIGSKALHSNTSGYRNTAMGFQALYSNVTGKYNTAAGGSALYSNTDGIKNTAFGRGSLYNNTSGSGNTAHGESALINNTTGSSNVAVGTAALNSSTDRSELVAIGSYALYWNGTNVSSTFHAIENTAIGYRALYDNSNGSYNSAVGFNALASNNVGKNNTASGRKSLEDNTIGDDNTAVGSASLQKNISGSGNTAIGSMALASNTSGSYNTAIGYGADFPWTAGLTNTGAFGYNAKAFSSNTIKIGNADITQIGGYVGWSNLSDGRFKTNITQDVPGLDFILKLQPVTFNWDLHALEEFRGTTDPAGGKEAQGPMDQSMKKARREKEKKTYTGFVAQEVVKAAEACGFDFSGIIHPANEKSVYNLTYAEFVVPLVKAVQEQQQQAEALKKQVEAQQKLIEQLLEKIE